MNPNQVVAEIREMYQDWGGLLANPRYCRNGDLIAWTAYDGGKVKEPVTRQRLIDIVEQRQFSFQCAEDGSVIQLLYRFSSTAKLEEARLAFYSLSSAGTFEDGTAEIKTASWLRINYDLQVRSNVLHSECHLHIHGFPGARLIVNSVPGPRQFIEFVMASFYPDHYKVNRLNDLNGYEDPNVLAQVNQCQWRLNVPGLPAILHLSVPKS